MIKIAILNACLYMIMLPWQQHIRQINYQKVVVCVVNLRAAILGDQRIKGFREKRTRNRDVKNCVQPS